MYHQNQIRITVDKKVKEALEKEAKKELIKPTALARAYLLRHMQQKGILDGDVRV